MDKAPALPIKASPRSADADMLAASKPHSTQHQDTKTTEEDKDKGACGPFRYCSQSTQSHKIHRHTGEQYVTESENEGEGHLGLLWTMDINSTLSQFRVGAPHSAVTVA